MATKRHRVGKSGNAKAAFETAAKGLPFYSGIDLSAEVVSVEPVDASYFRDVSRRQRCIIRRRDGNLYLASYE